MSASTRQEFQIESPKVRSGLIASGDQFVTDAKLIADLRAALPDLLCVEMEGAAVAQVCDEHERPLLVVRIISDLADHSAAIDFPKFLRTVATTMGTRIAERIVQDMSHLQVDVNKYV